MQSTSGPSSAARRGRTLASIAASWVLVSFAIGCSDSAADGGLQENGTIGVTGGGEVTSTTGAPVQPGSTSGTGGQPRVDAGAISSNGSGGNVGSGSSSSTGSGVIGVTSGGGSGSGGATTGAVTSPDAGATADAGSTAHLRDHCLEGYDPDPSDGTMMDGPAEYTKAGQIDLTVQPAVITWMQNHKWEAAHFEWHSIRRCTAGTSQSRVNICSHTELVPTDQECKTTGDGFQFLAMHRHMMQSLRQLFPKHTEQFSGFPHFPQSANDVPAEWRSSWSAFSAQDLANAKIADEIDKPENLAKFADEGAFGQWLQCLAPQFSGLHGDLHFKWVRSMNTDHGLGNQETNIDNYMFWKLHGWIDQVWEKYRTAKGLSPDDPKLKDGIVAQCRQMDQIAQIIDPSLQPPPNADAGALPTESGEFVTGVRTIFESDTYKCSGCHGPTGAEAGLTLGGAVSGASIVAELVNKPSTHGGQYKYVVPGDPDHSWLYLKVSGKAASSNCTATPTASCNTEVMPLNSSGQTTVGSTDLAALRKWIMDGAPAPTSP